jgi:transposase
MVRQEVWMDVKLMHRQGHSLRHIARVTGMSRVTVRRILSAPAPKGYGPRPQRPSKLDPFVPQLEALVAARPKATASWLHRQLVASGFAGCYEMVKLRMRARRREERARARACVRFETAPGLESQFDWKGPVKGLIAGTPELGVHFFRFVLAWSRARWTLVVPDLKLPATLAALNWAFGKAGGVTQRLVLDNPKTCVTRPKPHLELHPQFLAFCRHFGCEPDPAWPYHPERKGKTERSLRDLDEEGVLDTTYTKLAVLQAAVTAVDEARLERVHTTTGEPPAARLERERAEMMALPAMAFDPRVLEIRRVLSDCTVSLNGARYSVPFAHVGTRVIVKADPLGSELEVFAGAECVARHARAPHGARVIVEEHVAELRRPRFERLRERASRSQRAAAPRETLSVVPWPLVTVEQRDMAAYAEAVGGAR